MISLGGFGFTMGGIANNISEADREQLFTPFFSPDGEMPTANEIIADGDGDGE